MVSRLGLGVVGVLALTGVDAARNGALPAAAVATGTITIRVALVASAGLPDGTTLSISPSVYVSDAAYSNTTNLYLPDLTITGRRASTTIRIPYQWTVGSRDDQVSVSLYVYGTATGGASDSSSFSSQFAIPANGTNTVVSFAGSI